MHRLFRNVTIQRYAWHYYEVKAAVDKMKNKKSPGENSVAVVLVEAITQGGGLIIKSRLCLINVSFGRKVPKG